jgi:AraC-like DNA-binding protein
VGTEGCDAIDKLAPGDLAVIPQGQAHWLLDQDGSNAVDLEELLAPRHFENQEPLIHGGGGARTSLMCLCFHLVDRSRSSLLMSLPPLLSVKGDCGRPRAYVDYIYRLIAQESASDQPCAQTIINRLVRILLIRTVYHHTSQLPAHERGWIKALIDPEIGQALALIHRQPEVQWTVASLADAVAMSRSAFFAKFGAMLGKPPLEYLTQWRMQRACVLLTASRAGLKEIALQVGYDSAAAFSKAFTKWAGVPPTTYRDKIHDYPKYAPVPPNVA